MTEFNAHAHLVDFSVDLANNLLNSAAAVNEMAERLEYVRRTGSRLFILGMGGGAANASHAANDFRKLCGIEAYAPTDCVAEITARANDEGLATIFTGWLEGSRFGTQMADTLLIFSVGGGTEEVSVAITRAVELAKERGAHVMAVVGRSDGAAATYGHAVVIASVSHPHMLTPVTETLQIAVLHMLVSDPRLQCAATKW